MCLVFLPELSYSYGIWGNLNPFLIFTSRRSNVFGEVQGGQVIVTARSNNCRISVFLQGQTVCMPRFLWELFRTKEDVLLHFGFLVAQLCPTLCDPMDCARLPCPSLSPGVCSDSCPSSCRCYPTISFSATPFSSCCQSFPASGSFSMNQLFASPVGKGNQMVLWSLDPGHMHSLFAFTLWTPRSSDRSQLLLLWPGAKFLVVTSGLYFLS